MVTEILPTYEVDPLDQSIMPPRSRLYALEPVGVGTPLVESLTSYLTRLAHAHGVTVEKLAATELAPLVNKTAKAAWGKFTSRSRNLNGVSGWTPLTIEALEKLTLRNDLSFLTMYPWRNVIARNKLLKHHLAWCPACYNQWQQADQTIYNPLLWALKPVRHCPYHRCLLCDRCPYPDCRQQLRLINSKVKLGYCSACKRWLGSEPASTQDNGDSTGAEQGQTWFVDQLGRLLAATPTLDTCPEQHVFALNIKSCLAAVEPDSVRGLARKIGLEASPLFGWMNQGHHPQLDLLARVCYHLDRSLLEVLAPQPDRDYDQLRPKAGEQKPVEPKVEVDTLRRQLEHLLADPDRSPGSAAQVGQQLGVGPAVIRRHCPEQYQQIIQQNAQYQQAQRQARHEKLARKLKAILDSDEIPPPSMKEVARRLQIHPGTARQVCPELCRLISGKRRVYYETRKAKVEAELQEILASNEEPPPSISQVAIRLGENTNYLYEHFPALCRVVTRRHRAYRPPINNQAPGPRNQTRSAKDHAQIRRQFTALITTEKMPPPSLAEVSRQLACSITTLRRHHSDLCRQLRQQGDAYRQRQRSMLEDKLGQILAVPESPPPSAREIAQRLNTNVSHLKQLLPDLYAEIVHRYQTYRQAEKQRRQAFLAEMISGNPVPPPSLSQVAESLGCDPSALQRQFPTMAKIIVKRYRTYREQERKLARTALAVALADDQNPPLLPIQVARQLGYEDSKYLLTYFPELCHQLYQRYEAHKRHRARTQLEAILVEPQSDPPLPLGTISRQLGYHRATLKHLCPDLCQVVEERHQTYWEEKKRGVKQTLEAILSDERTPPISVNAVAREFGYFPGTIRRYFPNLAAAVSAKYKIYARERGRQRRRHLDEKVKRMTRALYQAGIDPTLRQISFRLPNPKMIITPHIRQAWREARNKLGLPT
jgi:AraC-like DNA-binding protein